MVWKKVSEEASSHMTGGGGLTNSFSLDEKQLSSESGDTNWGLICRTHKEYKVK